MDLRPKTTAGIVLAAGRGSRMGKGLPKVLREISHRSVLGEVVSRLRSTKIEHLCVVVPEEHQAFAEFISQNQEINFCTQEVVNGTASALASAAPFLQEDVPNYAAGQLISGQAVSVTHVLVCLGDSPAIDPEEIENFRQFSEHWDLAILGAEIPDPTGYGRLLTKSSDELVRIVEEKDLVGDEKQIRLCNTGILAGSKELVYEVLRHVSNDNNQGEYYLTDCVALANQLGKKVGYYVAKNWRNFRGINTENQLEQVRSYLAR